MLLLHGGSNAYRSGLLVLQHVSEALEVGGGREGGGGGSRRRGEGAYRGGGGSRFHIKSFLMSLLLPHRLCWL